MSLLSRLCQATGRVARAAVLGFLGTFSMRDYLLFAGLALLAYGLSLVSVPAAYIVPGAVLALVAIFGVR